MPRIRTIKPEFWTSEQVVECSPSARLLFIGLWNFCDDSGRHPASVRRLKMEVFPGDNLDVSEVAGYVEELGKNGLIIEYEAQGEKYWQVTGWKHQKVDRPNSKYPPPPFDEDSTNERRAVVEQSPPEKEKEKEKEKDTHKRAASPRVFVCPSFEEVVEYATGRNGAVDPREFYDFYESNGWKDKGGNRLKDWKAKFRGWEKRSKPAQKPVNGHQDAEKVWREVWGVMCRWNPTVGGRELEILCENLPAPAVKIAAAIGWNRRYDGVGEMPIKTDFMDQWDALT